MTAQLTQSATGVAEAILKRNEEAVHNREQLAQARLEAQLKPVAESLQKFQEHVALVEKARVEETGGLKQQISALLLASTATQDEARKPIGGAPPQAPAMQGRWGRADPAQRAGAPSWELPISRWQSSAGWWRPVTRSPASIPNRLRRGVVGRR